MLKIGKGLHKKKKSKKNKNKKDELFTEEELVQYRKEREQRGEDLKFCSDSKITASEDFEKFKALTAGVDDVLRKSQGDLDRIKKESFFQRKPTPSELKAQEEKEKKELKLAQGNWIDFEDQNQNNFQLPVAEKEEKESDLEDDYDYKNDEIFDTTYVNALESGEVKLAYVSEDDEVTDVNESDPFDTTSAEEILKKVEEEENKKKQQISLGLAVKVLTGRAERDKTLLKEKGIVEEELDESVAVRRPKKRPRKIQDISLIGSFDEGSLCAKSVGEDQTVTEASFNLLNNDIKDGCRSPERDELISGNLLGQKEVVKTDNTENVVAERQISKPCQDLKDVVSEFDVINEKVSAEVRKAEEVEDQFDEFTALAVSSVTNQKLDEELQKFKNFEDDPFDTSKANIVLKEPGDPFGNIDSDIPLPQVSELSSLNNKWSAFEPIETKSESEIDPFDTTFVEKITPGKCELKLLESEILSNLTEAAHKSDVHQEARILSRNNSESDYYQTRLNCQNPKSQNQNLHSSISIQITNPSGFVETQKDSENGEAKEKSFVQSLSYKYRDLLGGSTTDLTKVCKDPLPPEIESPTERFPTYSDPFDTSIVADLTLPGKTELKFIEKELLSDIEKVEDKDSLSDENFDLRGENITEKRVSFQIPPTEGLVLNSKDPKDIRPLTPYCLDDERDLKLPICDFEDPFDTSHLTTLPGKEEIKIIEKELNSLKISEPAKESVFQKLGIVEGVENTEITSNEDLLIENDVGRSDSDKFFSFSKLPNNHFETSKSEIFSEPADPLVVREEISAKALTPEIEEDILSYIDPFDTSIAENILPGKAELKVLESELIGESQVQGTIKRSYTDPDFDPRDKPEIKPGQTQELD